MSADRPGTSSPTRDDFPVLRRISTRWSDEDVYGHVNNVTYYSYFDTAVNGYLIDATGADIRRLDAIGLVVESGCRFTRELGFPEDVEVGLAVEKLGSSSIVYEIGLFQGESSSAAAIGRFVHVYVTREGREVTPVPEVIRTAAARIVRGR